MIGLERLSLPEEVASLQQLVAAQAKATSSPHAQALLANWEGAVAKFWKVVPFPPTPDAPKPVYRYAG
jgi:glutamate synthase (NADPH/NADH) large chain/glutamate synthase (ferredoxin)